MQRTLRPRHDSLRDAIRWLAGRETVTRSDIEAASVRFDLGPLEEDFLLQHFITAESDERTWT